MPAFSKTGSKRSTSDLLGSKRCGAIAATSACANVNGGTAVATERIVGAISPSKPALRFCGSACANLRRESVFWIDCIVMAEMKPCSKSVVADRNAGPGEHANGRRDGYDLCRFNVSSSLAKSAKLPAASAGINSIPERSSVKATCLRASIRRIVVDMDRSAFRHQVSELGRSTASGDTHDDKLTGNARVSHRTAVGEE